MRAGDMIRGTIRNTNKVVLMSMLVLLAYLCVGCTNKNQKDTKSQTQKQSGNQTQGRERLEVAYDSNYDAIGGEGLLFQIDEEKKEAAVISYYDVEMKNLTLPDVIVYEGTEYPVTKVGESTFESDQSIQTVTFGKNIKSIDASAFYAAAALTDIVLPDALESIGEYAFASCTELEQITWGKAVSFVGNAAFQGDESLKTLELPGTITDWGNEVFMDCIGLTDCSFDEGAQLVGEGMFCNCSALTKVSLPDTVTAIGAEAFWDCAELRELTIPDTVLMIGDRAFYSTAIQTLRLPKRLSGIKLELLEGMAELEKIQVPETKASEYTDVFKNYGITIDAY
ncbi:MAG: leucine-rich repeat domain-containing protein [Eubacteriales bacterium]|nr:leucine-rich repeat domain-containing protein [Eubacteriales bacterium]